jgi:PHD/YefM family antitoxin component YafN of YafNO toxin-antitoxin module
MDMFPGGKKNTVDSIMGIQYIVDEFGDPTAVVVPIDEWNRLLEEVQKAEPERDDTTYLLQSEAMRKRLLEARERSGGKTWEEVQDALGI